MEGAWHGQGVAGRLGGHQWHGQPSFCTAALAVRLVGTCPYPCWRTPSKASASSGLQASSTAPNMLSDSRLEAFDRGLSDETGGTMLGAGAACLMPSQPIPLPPCQFLHKNACMPAQHNTLQVAEILEASGVKQLGGKGDTQLPSGAPAGSLGPGAEGQQQGVREDAPMPAGMERLLF